MKCEVCDCETFLLYFGMCFYCAKELLEEKQSVSIDK